MKITCKDGTVSGTLIEDDNGNNLSSISSVDISIDAREGLAKATLHVSMIKTAVLCRDEQAKGVIDNETKKELRKLPINVLRGIKRELDSVIYDVLDGA